MTATTATATTTPASPSDDQSLRWDRFDDPADAAFTWRFDLTHFPDPMTPLGYDLFMGPFLRGFGTDPADPTKPLTFDSRRVNGFVFMANLGGQRQQAQQQASPPAPPTLEERLARLEGMGRRWREELLPEITELIDYYRTTDFDALDTTALAHEIEQLRARRVRQGVLHDLALGPWAQAMTLLAQTYKDFSGGDGVQAMRLVQGYGNKSVEAGHALWRLSRLASSMPAVRERLLHVDSQTACAALAEIERDPTAAPFVAALRTLLDEYGWRNDLFELATPSWAEDPTIPLCQLRAYLQMEDHDPAAELARLAAERDTFVAETLAQLTSEQRDLLERVLEAVRDVVSLQEDHNFYIDQRLALLPRRLVLAAGRRLVGRGQLAAQDDVFYLHATELCAALTEPTGPDLNALVRRRRAELAHWATLTPPEHVGAPPPPQPPPSAPAVAPSSNGAAAGTLENDEVVILTGNGGSAGVARGPARILRTLNDADRLKPGDVLVARTTMPPWTPLFAVASALVVEVGGILSHPAVTAREYGLPAVLNVRGATTRLHDGQLVEVDGTRGRVRLLS
jgi:pyruvate,water dikinase